MFKQKITLLVVSYFLLNTCAGIKSINGYMPVQDSVDQLRVNVTSSSAVKSKLGEPALVLGSREPIFIYSSQVTDRVLFFEPKVISRDVLVLFFNKKNKLKNIEKFSLADGKSLDINNNTTKLNNEERSILATLFSNVGLGGVRIPD